MRKITLQGQLGHSSDVEAFLLSDQQTLVIAGEHGPHYMTRAQAAEVFGFTPRRRVARSAAAVIAFFDWLGQQNETLKQCYAKRLKLWGIK